MTVCSQRNAEKLQRACFIVFFFFLQRFLTQASKETKRSKRNTCFLSLAQSYIVCSFSSRYRASVLGDKRATPRKVLSIQLHPSYASMHSEVLAIHVDFDVKGPREFLPCTPTCIATSSSLLRSFSSHIFFYPSLRSALKMTPHKSMCCTTICISQYF